MLITERGAGAVFAASIAFTTACVKNTVPRRLVADDRVEILRRQIEEIAAHDRGHAGIVDEAVDPAEAAPRTASTVACMAGKIGEIGLADRSPCAPSAASSSSTRRSLIGSPIPVIAMIETVFGQRLGDAEPDAAAAAGDDGDGASCLSCRQILPRRCDRRRAAPAPRPSAPD